MNRFQPQSIQVDSGGSYESGRSCFQGESYCNQGKLGGVDGKVIKVSWGVGVGSDDSYER